MRTCEHCGEELLVIPCRTCDGAGGWWCDSMHTFTWNDCPTCHDARTEAVCTNTACPSIVWYPLSREDSATLRMVIASVEREEKR